MPELPEVEISARVAGRGASGREVTQVEVTPCKLFRFPRKAGLDEQIERLAELGIDAEVVADPQALTDHLNGARALGGAATTSRYGKLMALNFRTADDRMLTLFSRLGMTGKWVRAKLRSAADPIERAGVKLALTMQASDDRGLERLLFINTRMFGAVWGLISAPRSSEEELIETARSLFQAEVKASEMGPDALELAARPEAWIAHLRTLNQSRAIKTLLLDQRAIAGVGNIYAAEGIFHAKAHPLSTLKSLTDQQLALIAEGVYDAMRFTLESADGEDEVLYGSARGEQSPFAVYGREGLACVRCEASLVNMQISKRATVFCPRCQPAQV